MFETYNKILIKGRKYENETTFDFFKEDKRLAFVFGQNGSGKSTIAAGLYNGEVGNEDSLNSDLSVFLCGDAGANIAVRCESSVRPAAIRVFDEAYVDKNVRVQGDGMKTIVLVGENGRVQGELDALRETIRAKTDLLREKANELESRKDGRGRLPSEVKYDEINKRLKSESGWAERERILRDRKTRSPVNDEVIQSVMACSDNRPIMELNNAYKEALERLGLAKGNAEDESLVASVPIMSMPDYAKVEEELLALLPVTAQRPVNSEDVARILQVLHDRHQPWIEGARDEFSKQETCFCPYCMRDISTSEKQDIVDKIGKVIKKDAEALIARVKSISFPQPASVDERCKKFNPEYYNELLVVVSQIRDTITQYQSVLQTKLNNVFDPVIYSDLGLAQQAQKANNIISKIKSIQDSILVLINTRTSIQHDLSDLNKALAKQEIKDIYEQYEAFRQEELTLSKQRDDIERELAILWQQESALVSQLNETNLAVDEINRNLSTIYMSKSRMRIRSEGAKYVLKVCNKDIRVNKVSTGERNVLGLAYFFADMMRGRRPADAYNQEYLVVLDDPTSSFDQDVRVGVLSFLSQKFRKILSGNAASHILVLTHEFFVMYGLCRTFQKLKSRNADGGESTVYAASKLESDGVEPINIGNIDEYRHLLGTTYKYALGSGDVDGVTIGNTMRRMMEAFSTFMFKSGMEDLFIHDRAATYIGHLAPYFQTVLSRFVLNDESHLESHVHSLDNNGSLFAEVSDREKRRVAKDVICLLYLYSRDHVEAHLSGAFSNFKDNIVTWLGEIRESIAAQ